MISLRVLHFYCLKHFAPQPQSDSTLTTEQIADAACTESFAFVCLPVSPQKRPPVVWQTVERIVAAQGRTDDILRKGIQQQISHFVIFFLGSLVRLNPIICDLAELQGQNTLHVTDKVV